MANFDRRYLEKLRGKYSKVSKMNVVEQAEKFKLRYVLTIGDDIAAIDDKAQMYMNELPMNETSFEYKHPNLNKYLERCNVSFESFLVRNQILNILSPNPGSNRMTFIHFLLVEYREMILRDFFARWQLDSKSKAKVRRKEEHMAQAILSEFLDQPPFDADKKLDELTKEERETEVNYNKRIEKLRAVVENAKTKAVPSVAEKRAAAELEVELRKGVEDQINIIRADKNRYARALLQKQKEAMEHVYNGTFEPYIAKTFPKMRYTLPEPWEMHIDEASQTPYYHNPETGTTQWTRP